MLTTLSMRRTMPDSNRLCHSEGERERDNRRHKEIRKTQNGNLKEKLSFSMSSAKRQRRQKQNECNDNPNFFTQRGCAGGRYVYKVHKHTQTCLACTGVYTNLDTLHLVERESAPHLRETVEFCLII